MQSPSQFCLDFTTGAKSRSPKGATVDQINIMSVSISQDGLVFSVLLNPCLYENLLVFFPRRQIKVEEIFVHENYTAASSSKANDIALLRLGDIHLSISRSYDLAYSSFFVP